MKKTLIGSCFASAAACGLLLWSPGGEARATLPAGAIRYQVTITNTTANQIFSPVLAATHNRSIGLFRIGEPAIPELATLAEDGNNGDLLALLDGSPDVSDVVSSGAIMPGASDTVIVETDNSAPLLSLAGMLVSTNDTFMAVRDFALPLTRRDTVSAVAYDAGSEFNSEECAFIPGPPCGMMAHDPRPPEGFVTVSSGVHGIADLAEEGADWRNPVALVRVLRLD